MMIPYRLQAIARAGQLPADGAELIYLSRLPTIFSGLTHSSN